jgi:hypothetical protein
LVGDCEGRNVGDVDGALVGAIVGVAVGFTVGDALGQLPPPKASHVAGHRLFNSAEQLPEVPPNRTEMNISHSLASNTP